jgi:hypothetical protein
MQETIDQIQKAKANVEAQLWRLHIRLGQEYTSKLTQIDDAINLGELALAVQHLNSAMSLLMKFK